MFKHVYEEVKKVSIRVIKVLSAQINIFKILSFYLHILTHQAPVFINFAREVCPFVCV